MPQTMPMETANIPDTDMNPSRVALGTWAIGGWMWGGTDDAQAVATIKSAIDRGITLIDTAPAYGFGHAEELVGQALAEAGARKKVCIATKVGLDWNEGKVFRNAGRARIARRSKIRCGACGRMSSTSTRYTGRIRRRRSKRPLRRCASSIARGRFARSA